MHRTTPCFYRLHCTVFLLLLLDGGVDCYLFITPKATHNTTSHCYKERRKIHTHTFNGPFSGTTRVSWYQKVKPIWILLEQETVSGSGISWAICKSAPRSRQITTPVPHHSVFCRSDDLPAAQPTASKHWRHRRKIQ